MPSARAFRLKLVLTAVVILPGLSGNALARGDKYIPQLADGKGIIRTKIDIHNISPDVPITSVKITFFHSDGSAWVLPTNIGTADVLVLSLGRSQTLRIETLGRTDGLVSGYAIIRDEEGNSSNVTDYQMAVSVFYEVLQGSRVVDTVGVPVPQPSRRWVLPVETNTDRGLYSGFAIVNLANSTNRVRLKLWMAYDPSVADATDGGTVELVLAPHEHRAKFLNEPLFFPKYQVFRGVLVGDSEQPVAVVAMLQTQTAAGVQYATLAAEYLDSLHSESYVYLPERAWLDVDGLRVPFSTADDGVPHDLQYQLISSTVRYLVPQNGAGISPVGIRTANEFANIPLDELKRANYSATRLDMTDYGGQLVPGFTALIRTSQGRFGKLRVDRVNSSGETKDLVLQLYVYR